MICECPVSLSSFSYSYSCFLATTRTWGSTGKEVEKSTFWIEVPRILKNFKLSFIICFALIAMMIIFTTNAVPVDWQIPGWQWALNIPLALVVGCHILFPVSTFSVFRFSVFGFGAPCGHADSGRITLLPCLVHLDLVVPALSSLHQRIARIHSIRFTKRGEGEAGVIRGDKLR